MSRTSLLSLALVGALGTLAACTEDGSPTTTSSSRLSATEPHPFRHDKGDDRGPPDDRDPPGDRVARRAEMEARRAEMLAKFDADQDGTLSDSERDAMHRARVGEMLSHLDADGNGTISATEWEARPSHGRRRGPDFATVDTNHDGALSLDELTALKPPGRPPGPPPGDGPPPDDGDGPPPE